MWCSSSVLHQVKPLPVSLVYIRQLGIADTDSSPLESLACPYEYRTLSASKSLRLLIIKPGQDNEEIVCDLISAAFGEAALG
jgi:hypothetical protein